MTHHARHEYAVALEGPSSLTVDQISELKLSGGLGWGEIIKAMRVIQEGTDNLGQVVSQFILNGLTGSNVTQSGIFNVLDFVNSETNGRGLGRLCAHGVCRQGIGPGSACAGGACAGGGPPGGGLPGT